MLSGGPVLIVFVISLEVLVGSGLGWFRNPDFDILGQRWDLAFGLFEARAFFGP